MVYRTSAWGSSSPRVLRPHSWKEELWGLGLFCGALLLLCLNLGAIPLYHEAEVTVAQMAKEIVTAPPESGRWLYPTLAGEPSLTVPPLLPNLIAGVYQVLGWTAWTTRLPGAILGALSVWGLYKVGREVFHTQPPAVLGALCYLTLSPLLMTGRWAVVETLGVMGTVFAVYSVLRSRRDLRWGLAVGWGIGFCCLAQGVWGLSGAVLVVLFLAWDTPRLLSSVYLWWGLGLGLLPVGGWYWAQGVHYSWPQFSTLLLAHLTPMPGPSFSVLLVLFLLPGVLLGGYSLGLVQDNSSWGWAKLVWVWGGVALLGSLLTVAQGVSVLPLFLPLSLAMGAQLAEVRLLPSDRVYPVSWPGGLLAVAVVTVGCSLFYGFQNPLQVTFPWVAGSIALTMAMTGLLIARRDRAFPVLFFWGMYVSALLFVSSPHWMPTPAIAQFLQPTGAMLQVTTPSDAVIYTSLSQGERALEFYSDRTLHPVSLTHLQHYWHGHENPYFLLDYETVRNLSLPQAEVVGRVASYGVLLTKNR